MHLLAKLWYLPPKYDHGMEISFWTLSLHAMLNGYQWMPSFHQKRLWCYWKYACFCIWHHLCVQKLFLYLLPLSSKTCRIQVNILLRTDAEVKKMGVIKCIICVRANALVLYMVFYKDAWPELKATVENADQFNEGKESISLGISLHFWIVNCKTVRIAMNRLKYKHSYHHDRLILNRCKTTVITLCWKK